MNVRRLQLDVDKAVQRRDLLELAEAIDGVPGVEAVNITVTDIDIETVGREVTIEGDDIDIRQSSWTGSRSRAQLPSQVSQYVSSRRPAGPAPAAASASHT